ncbi:Ppx/GppA phosphatase family protein [Anaerobium acetethylicum]|uniref:Exopolyphosphatase / guanosine-5'-triphosphate,3'-diphosphate pyrophosphatase n=1 Tax=Anaerobium acetethylicum TaxID=1619234 RepID=A0A1D3TND1_9FIRM|nr:rod shape-determining protein [Anaerobium acetethylicum]SCP94816.1 exopolyphosphatase / guanosine-5'-triphosphate,3'-diphosphate pyrophosphatase [Anaerobium acetethylicum]
MITAIVDLGSNTIRLCVYDCNEGVAKMIFERKTMAGLVNFIEDKKLSNKGIHRACDILIEYKDVLNNFQSDNIDVHVFATASLRNIKNTEEVLESIKDLTGFEVDLISGKDEALLDFMGATRLFRYENGVLVDIGGGSTEIVVFKNREVVSANSFPVGSLNMYVKHVNKIIPKEKEREAIRKDVSDNLKALDLKQETIRTICGVGGTIRAAGKLNNGVYNLPSTNIDVDLKHVREILDSVQNSKKSTLKPLLQNVPDRIHTIIPGLIILDTIAEYFGSQNIVISRYGVREGYLYERVMKK